MGVAATSPGYATWSVRPQLGNLTWASIKYPTLKGPLLVAVNQTALSFAVTVTAPGNTMGVVCVPLLKDKARRKSGGCFSGGHFS